MNHSHNTSCLDLVFLFVLDSSFQRTVSSHSFPKHHVPRIPVFISLHFRATFLPFLHLRPSTQNPTQPTITEISRSPSPTNHTKQSRKYHSLPHPQKITEIFPLTTTAKKPRKYAYFCDFFWRPSWGTYSAIAPVIVMHNLKALAHTMHVHIRYAGNSNIVKIIAY